MSFFNSLRNLFGRPASKAQPARSAPQPEPEPEQITVPEMSVADLRTAIVGAAAPLLLDIREQSEWNQVRIPADDQHHVLHIPMNTIPAHLDDLPREQPIVVICAHGSRSYSVAHYLLEQGFQAVNLTGGITRWANSGGPIEQGKPRP